MIQKADGLLPLTAHIITYGCQMNKYDSDVISRILETNGYVLTDDEECASFVLINTCSIRKHAEDKVLSKLGQLAVKKKIAPELKIAVCGCMAQRLGNKLVHRFPEIDLVLGTSMIAELPVILQEVLSSDRAGVGRQKAEAEGGSSAASLLPVPLSVCCQSTANLRPGTTPSVKGERVYTGEPSVRGATPASGTTTVSGDACLYPETHPSPIRRGGSRLKSYVAVILGCDNYCSYCIVPYVRGKPRSRSKTEIIREIESSVGAGCREITLLGQNILAYGNDINESFGGLLADIQAIGGRPSGGLGTSGNELMRIRFLTSHPRDITEELIELCAELPKVCEHFHLPVQSGSDRILQAMRRGYTVEHYRRMVEKIRQVYPHPSITTDLIVGFPGETEADFDETMQLVKEIGFDTAFCFKYSPREGTPACKFQDHLPEEEKARRLKELLNVQKAIGLQINQALVGTVQEILLDEENPRKVGGFSLLGRTRGDKVVVAATKTHKIGDMGMVRIVGADSYCLKGVFVDE